MYWLENEKYKVKEEKEEKNLNYHMITAGEKLTPYKDSWQELW